MIAAPELLAACRAAVQRFPCQGGGDLDCGCVIHQMRAVIAKAEGR
jgi:hypothetical protein